MRAGWLVKDLESIETESNVSECPNGSLSWCRQKEPTQFPVDCDHRDETEIGTQNNQNGAPG